MPTRFTRPLHFALLAVLLLPVSSTAPVTLKYKISQHFSQTIDLTAMGQDVQSSSADYDVFATVVGEDSAGGHALSVTVDSVVPAAGSNPQMAEALTSRVKGAHGTGFVSAKGDVTGFPADMQGATLKGLALAVYPAVKAGAKPGDTWSDTTSTVDSMMGGALARKAVTNYASSAGEPWHGEATLKLVAAGSFTLSGTQNGAAVDGNGTTSSTLMVSPAGHSVSGQNSSKMDLSVTSPQAPMPIPVTNEISATITLLP